MAPLTQAAKDFVQETFPSLWLQWRLAHRPKSAEAELMLLDRIVRPDHVAVDVGANLGLYTRALARLARKVHAFEPSAQMAELLRKTSAGNVAVHEMALSDHRGEAELLIPRSDNRLIHSLASLEPHAEELGDSVLRQSAPMAPLDAVIGEDVAFIKIDVEGHELSVLNGAVNTLAISQPVFLIEAEERHRPGATAEVFRFFDEHAYRGYFILGGQAYAAEGFDPARMQDPDAMMANGERKPGRTYVNNFFFFPAGQDGFSVLNG